MKDEKKLMNLHIFSPNFSRLVGHPVSYFLVSVETSQETSHTVQKHTFNWPSSPSRHIAFPRDEPVASDERRIEAAWRCLARKERPEVPTCRSSAAFRWSCIL